MLRIESFISEADRTKPGFRGKALKRWWQEKRPTLRQDFKHHYEAWQETIQDADETILLARRLSRLDRNTATTITLEELTPAGAAYKQLSDLGVLALPLLIKAIREGDTTMVPLVLELTENEPEILELSGSDEAREKILIWWEKRKSLWILPDKQ